MSDTIRQAFNELGKQRALAVRENIRNGAPPSYIFESELWIPEYKAGVHTLGDTVRHLGQLYNCAQTHDSTGNPDWTPENTPALWAVYHGISPETARPFVQPTGAQDAYKSTEYALFDGVTYKSKVNGNVYSLAAYPANWEAVTGGG